MRKKLIIDFDDTMVVGNFLKIANEIFKENKKIEDLQSYYVEDNFDVTDSQKDEFYNELVKRDLYESAEKINDAYEILKNLSNEVEIIIFSACVLKGQVAKSGRMFLNKYEYILKNFDFIDPNNIVLGGNKSIISGEYFLDDKLENLECCNAKSKLLFTAYHNKNIPTEELLRKGILRINNYSELSDFITNKIADEKIDQILKEYFEAVFDGKIIFHWYREGEWISLIVNDIHGRSFMIENEFYTQIEGLLGMPVYRMYT